MSEKPWDFVFKPQGNLRKVYIVEGDRQKERYLTHEQLEVLNRARAPESRLDAIERAMREKQDAKEGKAYGQGRIPVFTSMSEASCALRWKSNVQATTAVKAVFTAAGYEVVSLPESVFDFVAVPGKLVRERDGAGSKTYYVLVKCGKSVTPRGLSARQLRRAEEQYLMPRFGLDAVKLYWYVRTADNTHKTYEIGKFGWRGRVGMKPTPNPLAELMPAAPDAGP